MLFQNIQSIAAFIPMIATSLISLGLVVTVHEFGHFIFCKLFGIGTPIFSVGFGTPLISRKFGETEFRISLIPLGGYCAIEDGDSKKSFSKHPYWQKVLVMLGGIIFNLILALTIFSAIEIGTVQKTSKHIVLNAISAQSAAEKAGLKKGDIVTHIDTIALHDGTVNENDMTELVSTLRKNGGNRISMSIIRDNKEKKIFATPSGESGSGTLGIEIDVLRKPIEGEFETHSITEAVQIGYNKVMAMVSRTFNAYYQVFIMGNLKGLGGPLYMIYHGAKTTISGLESLLLYMASISVQLALFNLLPITPLDGGQLFFLTIEAIIGRPINEQIKSFIISATEFAFLALILYVTSSDIMRMFGPNIMKLYSAITSFFGF